MTDLVRSCRWDGAGDGLPLEHTSGSEEEQEDKPGESHSESEEGQEGNGFAIARKEVLHFKKGGIRMELLTKALREQLPALYSQEHEVDPLVICKFFTPDSQWTWYPTEF